MFYKSLNLCYRVFRNTVQEYCTIGNALYYTYDTNVVLYKRESCQHCVTTSLKTKRGHKNILSNALKGRNHCREQIEVKEAFHIDFEPKKWKIT
jgi:hypothetical protein